MKGWLAGLCASGVVIVCASGAELPVRDGLVLWLDVSAQVAARQTASLPPIRNLQPVDLLLDSSGQSRNASQPVAERRPQFISDGDVAYLQFDGKDDFLAVPIGRKLSPEATVFVLAAPKTNPGISPGSLVRRRRVRTITRAG
jgi:hypothetical protein